ncbi:MAG: glutamine--tRNA ligase/YqeY domain fusion protein [Verrucomicrobiota bacterium]
MADQNTPDTPRDFIREIISNDLSSGKHDKIVTRFPPEPNGFLHIGHAKSICLNFGTAKEVSGTCHLRFDDTNPSKEDTSYVEAIQKDVTWLGYDWKENLFYASDYFEKLYHFAIELIQKEKAYVCTLNPEEFKEYRGVPTRPGKESPHRNRSVAENMDLFERMRKGEFEEGTYVLRAKIDMHSPNLHMRDPAIYRIKKDHHHRTGDQWCIYPMYDFAHCLSDAIECITHSLCTLEFEVHRPLYDWFIDHVTTPSKPRQIEFARLNLSYTVMSKRKLLQLVEENLVHGWDDPRLPTIAGMRRRGYTAESIREFTRRIGITKHDGLTDISVLEACIREELNKTAPRYMAVLKPLKLTIENYPEDQVEEMEAINNPEDPEGSGKRKIPFAKHLYIEGEDFMEDAPKKYFRLTPGREVRLRYGYIIKCTGCKKDPKTGEVLEVLCKYDPETRGGNTPDGRKIKGTIHWVSSQHCQDTEVRLYDRLFKTEIPDNVEEGGSFKDHLNLNSLITLSAKVEPSLTKQESEARVQFERKGYFFADPVNSKPGKPVFNQIVSLRDSWSKTARK